MGAIAIFDIVSTRQDRVTDSLNASEMMNLEYIIP